MLETKQRGKDGEDAVVAWLANNRYKILERNYQIRQGEIDIIAAKNEYIVFVEVKTRKSLYIPISSAVTPTKQRRIIKTAQHYIASKHLSDKVFRFDVATVHDQDGFFAIDYIENAFRQSE